MPGSVPGALIPITLFICGAAIAIFAPMAKAYARSLERKSSAGVASPEIVARLERMESAIESIAIEIERISEGQRFTTKLLSGPKGMGLDAGSEVEER